MRNDVAMSFEDVHDLESVIHVTEEDDVALERKRPEVRAKLGPGHSERAWESSQCGTLVAQAANETLRYCGAATFHREVPENGIEILLSGLEQAEARHQYPRAF